MGFDGFLTTVAEVAGRDDLLYTLARASAPPVLGPLPDTSVVAAGVPTDDGVELVEVDPAVVVVQAAYDGVRAPRGDLPVRLRRTVLERLILAQRALPSGLTLAVLDGWRSMAFQRELTIFYGAQAVADGYVSPTDAPGGFVPPHVTGGAVDLTLAWKGTPLSLGTDFDSFDARAHADALEAEDTPERAGRRLLFHVLTKSDFAPYPFEWWHYSYGDNHWANWRVKARPMFGVA